MRIACVDKSASERIKLQKFVELAYESCRSAVGHLSFLRAYPAAIEEVRVQSAPEVIIVGTGFSLEESFHAARNLRESFPKTPLFVLLSPQDFSLRTLRRFDGICNDVISLDDSPIRLIHHFCGVTGSSETKHGRLVVAQGVKGGVGTTSIVSGLAHAAQGLGKEAVVIDLSAQSCFAHYMMAERWHSPDLTSILMDHIPADPVLLDKLITQSRNGIRIFLPPSGGTEVREVWLRDPNRFELFLAFVELLCETYDLVLVDTAHAEGILHYAMHSRADVRLLITSNDPASVHLLSHALSQFGDLPGRGDTRILINLLNERGLRKNDILAFISNRNEKENTLLGQLDPLTFDAVGRNWIGTGNSFYTESSRSTQLILEKVVATLCNRTRALDNNSPDERSPSKGFRLLGRDPGYSTAASPTEEWNTLPLVARLEPPSKRSPRWSFSFSSLKGKKKKEELLLRPQPLSLVHGGLSSVADSFHPDPQATLASTESAARFPLYRAPQPVLTPNGSVEETRTC